MRALVPRIGIGVVAVSLVLVSTAPLGRAAGQQAGSRRGQGARASQSLLCRLPQRCRSGSEAPFPSRSTRINVSDMKADANVWETVVRKMRAGVMPPAGMPRPDRASHDAFLGWLEGELDRAAQLQPESRPDRAVPSAQPQPVPERDSRSAQPRDRRRLAPAVRRLELRFRQHRRRVEDVADIDGAISRRRRRRSAAPLSARRRRRRPSTISASPTTWRRIGACQGSPSARAVARRFATRSRWTPSTPSACSCRATSTRACRSTPRISSSRSAWTASA